MSQYTRPRNVILFILVSILVVGIMLILYVVIKIQKQKQDLEQKLEFWNKIGSHTKTPENLVIDNTNPTIVQPVVSITDGTPKIEIIKPVEDSIPIKIQPIDTAAISTDDNKVSTVQVVNPLAIFYNNLNFTGESVKVYSINQEVPLAVRSGVQGDHIGRGGIKWLVKSIKANPGTILRLRGYIAGNNYTKDIELHYDIPDMGNWFHTQKDENGSGILGLFMYNKAETASWYYWKNMKWYISVLSTK